MKGMDHIYTPVISE